MARFGRGQPHAPIFLRAPLVAVVAAAAAFTPIHVVLAEARRPAPTHISYVRPSRASFVPDRLASQIHVIGVRAPSPRRVDVLQLRNSAAPAVESEARAPRLIVVLTEPRRSAGHVLQLHNPAAPVVAAEPRAPRATVVLTDQRRGVSHIIQLHAPAAPVVVATPAPWPHVLTVAEQRALRERQSSVLYVRPSRTSLVPDRLPVRVHVISQVGSRIRVMREPVLLFVHGGPVPVVAVALPLQLEDRSGFRYGAVDASGVRYVVIEQGGVRYAIAEDSSAAQQTVDQSHPRVEGDVAGT